MRVTLLAGGGCNIRITFADQGTVRSIGSGRVVKAVAIPTKRIARRYEILIRHENGFESSYAIVDQTPSSPMAGLHRLAAEGGEVHNGTELYDIHNGGFLDFQLFHKAKLVDPRSFIRDTFDGATDVARQLPET